MFCTECGHKMGYSLAKPNFCSKCGAGTGSVAKSSLSKPKKSLLGRRSQSDFIEEESLAEDETSIDYVPDISRLDCDIEQYDENIFTLGSLAGKEDRKPRVRNRGSKNLEDFINDKRK